MHGTSNGMYYPSEFHTVQRLAWTLMMYHMRYLFI